MDENVCSSGRCILLSFNINNPKWCFNQNIISWDFFDGDFDLAHRSTRRNSHRMIFIESTWKYAELNCMNSHVSCCCNFLFFIMSAVIWPLPSFGRIVSISLKLNVHILDKKKNKNSEVNKRCQERKHLRIESNQVNIFTQINKFVWCEIFRFQLIIPFGYVQRWSAFSNYIQIHNMNS